MQSFTVTGPAGAPKGKLSRSRTNVMMSTTAISTAVAMMVALPTTSFAQTAAKAQTAEQAPVEEIVVTGSRIVREGYEAPTPLTVVGTEQLEKAADSNIANMLATMPAITGAALATNGQAGLSPGGAGISSMNLRSLGANRVLVLLDGQRVVPSTIGGAVDIGSFPQQLLSRVDVVTGGASAVYGSDAVAGVVNFILDRKFTGVKGELSGGLTNYGDDKNYKVALSAGFGFAGDRGHVLLSGSQNHNQGTKGDGGRAWNRTGWQQITNPAYTATNGQPNQLFIPSVVPYGLAPGGTVIAGPLKGTTFGAGGTPFQLVYGPIVSNPYMQGGDWQVNELRQNYTLDPKVTSQTLFGRVGYDVTDNINMYVQYNWAQNKSIGPINNAWILGAGGPIIKIDNAYLPASVRTAMATAGVTQIQLNSQNADLPQVGTDYTRIVNSITGGLEGTVNLFDGTWHWNGAYTYGGSKNSLHARGGIALSRVNLAADAVVNPANGQIVCRSVLQGLNTTCRPWNFMGVGVNQNNTAGQQYLNTPDFQHGLVEESTFSAALSGEPFSLWAGPVSTALSFEHRADAVHADADADSKAFNHYIGTYSVIDGEQSVTEGAVETIIPLAKGESWADSWDFTAAARFTGYSVSGYVTTWKLGTTYSPIPDVKFRVTRSRDIRAPNIQELFAAPEQVGAQTVIDRAPGPTNGTTAVISARKIGNIGLTPEKADTTGIGVVLQPRFLEGFSASVDYWDVGIKQSINPISFQQVVDSCYNNTRPELCPNIIRTNGIISLVIYYSINAAVQVTRGLDFEASYRTPLSAIVDGWRGDLALHGNATVYLRNYQDNSFNPPTNHVGENNSSFPPYWKLNAGVSYALDPVNVSLTARAFAGGRINSEYVECTSGCPTSTAFATTINTNKLPGRFYLDANVSYKMDIGLASSELFLSARNLLNNDPPPTVEAYYQSLASTASLYDSLGAIYRVGIRFKM